MLAAALLGRCEGGIGIAARLHGRMAPLLRTALEMATACPCRDGCWCRLPLTLTLTLTLALTLTLTLTLTQAAHLGPEPSNSQLRQALARFTHAQRLDQANFAEDPSLPQGGTLRSRRWELGLALGSGWGFGSGLALGSGLGQG